MNELSLPAESPARVLALGAWLKNTACLVDGRRVQWSRLHGDLGTPEACMALDASAESLIAACSGPIDAVAHDLHPDFPSTRLAVALAERLGVPAIGVQHHHAHIGVVQAEHAARAPVIGLALDGVGLGTDDTAWGGELLRVAGNEWARLDHLAPLALPGGDVAAREPWRMAAAALHAMGRTNDIVPRFAPIVGEARASGVKTMLARSIHCPATTSAGRWFDAAAGLLGISVRQKEEAEAAIALERAATSWLATHDAPPPDPVSGLDLLPLAALLVALADRDDANEGAARFHVTLAHALARAAIAAAQRHDIGTVVLGGGCFFNRLLTTRLVAALEAAGLRVLMPRSTGPGDAGLALGQAWIAALTVASAPRRAQPQKDTPCA